jgi:hypothetical protein
LVLHAHKQLLEIVVQHAGQSLSLALLASRQFGRQLAKLVGPALRQGRSVRHALLQIDVQGL